MIDTYCGPTERLLCSSQQLVIGLGCIFLSACTAQSPYLVMNDMRTAAANVSGQVTLVGPIPNVQQDRIYRDSGLCGEEIASEDLTIAEESRGIEGVIISLEGIKQGKPLPKPVDLVIENRGCRFLPQTLVAISGAILGVQNLDPVMHYTHARLETRYGPTQWNVIQIAGSEGVNKSLTTSGLLDIRCDLHPSMKAFVHVFDHPYFAKTNLDGQFELTNVPPGNYVLKAWHMRFGIRQRPVTVPEQGTLTVDIPVEIK